MFWERPKYYISNNFKIVICRWHGWFASIIASKWLPSQNLTLPLPWYAGQPRRGQAVATSTDTNTESTHGTECTQRAFDDQCRGRFCMHNTVGKGAGWINKHMWVPEFMRKSWTQQWQILKFNQSSNQWFRMEQLIVCIKSKKNSVSIIISYFLFLTLRYNSC